MNAPNIFVTLSKYGSSEAENYLTEAFVFLLDLLLERTPEIGLAFVNKVCGLSGNRQLSTPEAITISTQIVVDEGRPDIQIKQGADTLIYVEVKHDASLGIGQLEYYKRKLTESDVPNTELVLLTRSRISTQETDLNPDEYHHICWHEIHNWLSNSNIQDKVCKYFVGNFMKFLESKQMSLQQVTWEYIRGVPALIALTDLIEVALLEAMPQTKLKRSAGWGWRGFGLDGGLWCGVRYDKPLIVVFENNNGRSPAYKRDLNLNEEHFFSLSQGKQLECLISFIKQSMNNASS